MSVPLRTEGSSAIEIAKRRAEEHPTAGIVIADSPLVELDGDTMLVEAWIKVSKHEADDLATELYTKPYAQLVVESSNG